MRYQLKPIHCLLWLLNSLLFRRIEIHSMLGILVLAATVMSGCGEEKVAAQPAAVSDAADRDILSDGFRIRRDAARNRIWVLGIGNVRVYEGQTKRLVRKIALPSWSVVRFACDPDIVLDGSGSAIVSSNTEPRLWRIDVDTFEVAEHQITLQGRERWDVGFAALAVSVDGTLFALTSVSASLWKIDLGMGRAQMVAPAAHLVNVCGLTLQSSGRAVGR